MKFYVCNEETGNKEILLEKSVWTGKIKMFLNGQPLRKLGKNFFTYQDNDGRDVDIHVKGSEILGLDLTMNGRKITVLRKLNALEIVLSLIPLVLMIFGGAIGGACAAVGMLTIAAFCRKMDNFIVKILFSLGIYGAVLTAWYIIVGIVLGLI